MRPSYGSSRNAWALPIVLLICALMVMPASALLARPSAPSLPHSVGATVAAHPTHAAGSSGSMGSLSPYSPTPLPSPVSAPKVDLASSGQSVPFPSLSSHAPWLQRLGGGSTVSLSRSGYAPLVSPPNLGLAVDPTRSPGAQITPGYAAPPAPMGLADYGYGAGGAYAYNTSSFLATVDLTSPPNVTAPSSEGVIDPQGSALGLVGSPYEFSLQLNTIGTNFTEPNTSTGVVWAQNVLDINGTGIHFIDDVWNLSTDSDFAFAPNALISGCSGSNLPLLLGVEGGVYQCVGGSIPISPLDYPLEIQLYNNVSVNSVNEDVLAFGFAIWGDGVLLGAGNYDTLVFANPSGVAPVHPIAFTVSGFSRAPVQPAGLPQLLEDSEITFGGPIGGANAVFRSLHGSLALDYWTGAAWTTIPTAYNFGSDTGETSVGLAGYWNSTGTELINQGPSFLYGLWGTSPEVGVEPGAIQFQGSINESYGFVFVSNVDPLFNQTNLSYVPTTVRGTFDSWLPPSVPAFGSVYYSAAYAPGNDTVLGPTFSTNQSAYTFPQAPSSLPYLGAPLYMLGDAQAASLAYNLTGRPLDATWSYNFTNLRVNLPIAFTHLNDYDFPSFVLVQAEQLAISIVIFNVTEGSNAFGGELYTLDFALPPAVPGWITPAPSIVGPWKNFTEQFDLWASYEPTVVDERLNGSLAFPNVTGTQGGVVFFFSDVQARAYGIGSTNGSYGVANIESVGTFVEDLFSEYGANALDDIGSWFTESVYIETTESLGANTSIGVYALSSHYGTFEGLFANDGAIGFYSGADTGAGAAYSLLGSVGEFIGYIAASNEARGVVLAYSHENLVYEVEVGLASLGALVDQSSYTRVEYLTADEGYGVDLVDSTYSTLINYTLVDYGDGSYWAGSSYIDVVNATFVDYYEAIYGVDDNYTSFTNLTVAYPYPEGPGLLLEGMFETSFTNVRVLNASEGSAGIVLAFSEDTTFSLVSVVNTTEDAAGIVVAYSTNSSISDFTVENVSESAYGLFFEDTWNTSLLGGVVENLSYDGIGVYVEDAYYTNVTLLFAENTVFGAVAVEVGSSNYTTFVGLSVEYIGEESAGAFVYDSFATSFSLTNIEYLDLYGVGIALVGTNVTTWNVTSVGYVIDDAIGIGLLGANATTFLHTVVYDVSAPGKGIEVLEGSYGVSFTQTLVAFSEYGVVLNGAPATALTETAIYESVAGVMVNNSTGVHLSGTYVEESEVGVAVNHSAGTQIAQTYVDHSYAGLFVNASSATTLSNLVSNGTSLYGAYVQGSSGLTLSGVTANGSIGAYVNASSAIVASGIHAVSGGTGLALVGVTDATVSGVSVSNGSQGVVIDPSSSITVANVTATNLSQGVAIVSSSGFTVTNVSATGDSEGVALLNASHGSVSGVQATNGSVAVWAELASYVTVSELTASVHSFAFEAMEPSSWVSVSNVDLWNSSVGVVFFGGSHDSVTNVTATNHSAGVGFLEAESDTVSQVSVSDVSAGVVVEDSHWVSVSDVTATNATTSSPWTNGSFALFDLVAAAVQTSDDYQVNISAVSASHYPLGLFDLGSEDLFVQSVNASFGAVGVELNGTFYSLFSGLGLYADGLGLVMVEDAEYNTVTASHFVNDTGYGVDLLANAYANLVYDNDFVGDNGANNLTYQATHVQAFSWSSLNWFNDSAKIGNYWAEWHVYVGGVLAPYDVANGAWDYHPLGAPEGKYLVTVTAVGLLSGTKWTVTVGGQTQSSYASAIVFPEFPGNYAWQVSPIAGWNITPASGVVVVSNTSLNLTVDFAAEYQVTFAESGLPAETSWSVVLNGVEASGSGTSIVFTEVAGTYAYTVLAPAGWLASPAAGTVTVSGNYLVPVGFTSTAVPMYTVWLNETGLSGASPTWGATFNGVHETVSGASLVFSVPAGSYSFQIAPVAGYTASPSSGIVTVSGNDTIAVVFTPTSVPVTVQIHESGLPKGTAWSAHVGGIAGTSTGNTLNVTVQAGGTYFYEIDPLAGYTVSHASGTLYVGTTTYVVTVAFAAVTYTVTFGESGLSAGTVWSVVVDSSTYTGSGTTITVQLTNGSHAYAFGAVSGYTVSAPSGSVTVHGSATGVAVSFAPTSSPSYVAGSTFNTDWGIALGIAAAAIVLALVALLRKPRAPASAPPATWQEGPPSGGPSSGGDSSSQGPTHS